MWGKSEFSAAEQLYTLCLDLSDTADRTKLLRNIATCQVQAVFSVYSCKNTH